MAPVIMSLMIGRSRTSMGRMGGGLLGGLLGGLGGSGMGSSGMGGWIMGGIGSQGGLGFIFYYPDSRQNLSFPSKFWIHAMRLE
jgi:hypothetical protein